MSKKDIPDFYKDLPYDRIGTTKKSDIAHDVRRFHRLASFVAGAILFISIATFAVDQINRQVPQIRGGDRAWISSMVTACERGAGNQKAASLDEDVVIAMFMRTDSQWEHRVILKNEAFLARILDGSTTNVVACVERITDEESAPLVCANNDGGDYSVHGGKYSVVFRSARDGHVLRNNDVIHVDASECPAISSGERGEDILLTPTDEQLMRLFKDVKDEL